MKWLLDFRKGKWLGHSLHPILAHVSMAMWPGALILAFPEVPNFAPASFNPILFGHFRSNRATAKSACY
jgi:hypothetical protein